MKFIKKFEMYDEEQKYNVGDYILIDIDKINIYNKRHGYNDPDDDLAIIIIYDTHEELPYTIKFYNKSQYSIREDEIVRLLTPDEIEQFKIKRDIKKYNL